MRQGARRQEAAQGDERGRQARIDFEHGEPAIGGVPEKIDTDESTQAGNRLYGALEKRRVRSRLGRNRSAVIRKPALTQLDSLRTDADQVGLSTGIHQEARTHGLACDERLEQSP